MDENQPLLTASKLWQGFCPTGTPLHSAIISRTVENGISFSYAAFTALEQEDGKARAAISIAESGQVSGPKPAILYLADYGTAPNRDVLINFASRGYIVFALNYGGQSEDEAHFTTYPESLSYGEYTKCCGRLNTAEAGADGTCVFLWARIARRAISFIENYPGVDVKKIALIANKGGANIGWQVAGTDERLSAFIPTFVAHEHEPVEIDQTRERDQWMMACTIGVYARQVKCPVLFAGATNSRFTPFEKLRDALKLLPKTTRRATTVSPLMSRKVSYQSLNAIDKFMAAPEKFPAAPGFSLTAAPAGIAVKGNILPAENLGQLTLCYASSDIPSQYRNWFRTTIKLDKDGNFSAELNLHAAASVIVYLEAFYNDNFIVTSLPDIITPEQNPDTALKKVKRTNIIYERKNGISCFVLENDKSQFFMEDKSLFIGEGPDKLFGITAAEGDLSTFAMSDPAMRGQDGDLLRFDAASDIIRELKIVLYAEFEGSIALFKTTVPMSCGSWQKITLARTDFKTCDGIPLPCWDGVKKTMFKDAAGLYLNNILWV